MKSVTINNIKIITVIVILDFILMMTLLYR